MTESSELPGPCKYFDYWQCHLAVRLWQIFSPILITVGTCGNLLSLAVLSRRRMCNSTTSVYLRWLAVTDTLVLLIGNMHEFIFYATNIDIRELSDATCRIHYWISLNLTALSGWMLCVLTIDRLVSVKATLWARSTCTTKTALIISVTISGCMFIINTHVLGYLNRTEIIVPAPGPNTSGTIVLDVGCFPSDPDYLMFMKKAWPLIVFVLYSVLPMACLITCNIMLIKELRKLKNPLRLMNGLTLSSAQRKDFSSVTRMLIVVCIFFAAVSLPATIYLIVEPYLFRGTSPKDISKRRLTWAIASLFMYTNNAANFYLYCLSGSLFRKELKDMASEIVISVRQRMRRRVVPLADSHTGHSSQTTAQPGRNIDGARQVSSIEQDVGSNAKRSLNCSKSTKTTIVDAWL